MVFSRVSVDPTRTGGSPCIRELRISVATVVDMVAEGMVIEDILHTYPDRDETDSREALRFAAEAVREPEMSCEAPMLQEPRTHGALACRTRQPGPLYSRGRKTATPERARSGRSRTRSGRSRTRRPGVTIWACRSGT